jgi:hypothetical protein
MVLNSTYSLLQEVIDAMEVYKIGKRYFTCSFRDGKISNIQ